MKKASPSFIALLVLGLVGVASATIPPPPGSDPNVDPTGDAGVLKSIVQTGGGYNSHNGNATRSIRDIQVPGAVGNYGLDFTRHWNSTTTGRFWQPSSFGTGGWNHSWEWIAKWNDEPENEYCPIPFQDGGDPNDQQYVGSCFKTHIITVSYPDGHTQEFFFQRNNYDVPGTDLYAPPYPVDWQSHVGVPDHLRAMVSNGSQFWLYLSDGGSVHFRGDGGPGSDFVADTVIDPHGLTTELHYDPVTGLLSEVKEPAGRTLALSWKYADGWPTPVIDKVEGGVGDAFQRVVYHYNMAPNNTGLALYSVTYEGDKNPDAPTQDIYASYDYYGFGSPLPYLEGKGSGPMLQYADDPRFAGAMTRIRYVLQGMAGMVCSEIQAPPPGDTRLNWVIPSPHALLEERSGTTAAMVSNIFIPCGAQNGTPGERLETRGAGGKRKFYYGTASGEEPTALSNDFGQVRAHSGSVSLFGYDLHKVTDFASDPTTAPFDYQGFFYFYPRRIFDGRRIFTEVVMQTIPGSPVGQPDGSGRVAEIRHLGADNSTRLYNWSDSTGSQPRDSTRIPNDYNHWLFSQRDERGYTTRYLRDSLRRVTDIIYFVTAEQFTYNTFNQVTSHTLASGAVEHFEYDGRGVLQREWNSVDGEAAAKLYFYKPSDPDRVWRVQDGRARANGKEYSTQMSYNKRHQTTEIHYPSTGGASDPTVFYKYDAYGNQAEITNELGFTTKYKYDPYRRLIEKEEPLNAPSWNGLEIVASRKWNWYYDRWDDATQTLLDASTHTSNQWRVEIGPIFNAAGERRLNARKYDYNDRIIEETTGMFVTPNGDYHVGADTEVHQFTYDANGNKQTFHDPLTRITTYTYDNRNRLKQTIEPKRVDQSVNPTVTNEYDPTGNKTKVTFLPDNRTQRWLNYDPFGQPAQFEDERGKVTDMIYCWGPMRKLYKVTTHREKDNSLEDQLTIFSYDLVGKPTQILFPDQSHEDSSYELGELKTWTTRRSQPNNVQTKTIVYDARSREISNSWSDGTPGISRSWDDASRLTSLTNIFSSIDYAYNNAGEVIAEGNEIAGSGGRTQTNYYRYPDGSVAHLHYPGGAFIRRDYTARGQLESTGFDDDENNWWYRLAHYTYQPDGTVYQLEHGNASTTSTFGYDARGFPESLQHRRSDNTLLASRTYTRDQRDRIISFQKAYNPGVNPLENGRGDRFGYDGAGQLMEGWYNASDPANSGAGNTRYDGFSYDALGNRGQGNYVASRGQMDFTKKDNGLNQYSGWWPYNFIKYDDDIGNGWGSPGAANGVLMQDGWVTAGFNALNQPMHISSPAYYGTGNWMFFGYDPLGRCVKRWIGPMDENGNRPPPWSNPAIYFHYDGWNLLQEGANAWGPARVYVHGNRVDEVAWSYNTFTGEQAFHHYDALGHCTLLTDSAGNILEQYEYDAFGWPYFYDASGNAIGASDPVQHLWEGYSQFGNRFLFTGREWIPDLKLYDFRNRLYQPELGRFLQPDPKHFAAGDYNLYSYCHNDPVNKSDPMGLYVAGLTMFGGGDWTGRADGLTNLDVHRLNQGKVADAIRDFERKMELGSDPNVKWSGRVNEIHDPKDTFGPNTVARTDWAVASKASSDGGKIAGFGNELQVNIHWNDSSSVRSQLITDMSSPRGEFAHARDAFWYGWHSGQRLDGSTFPSARDTANGVARTLIGTNASTDAAEQQMVDALRPWVRGSTEASKMNHDPPWSTDHIY